jgi:ABC-2 type transport system ATP-binding protein
MMPYNIQITGLKKRFGETTAVDGLDLLVNEGEMLGLIGPDGAGKTTTLRILCGLLHADSGECLLADKNVRTEVTAVRSFIGYMPQKFSLYPDLTVSENLRFFADLFQVKKNDFEKRVARLLAFSRLSPFSGRKAAALSGGMKQKLALSCTLIHTPKILLLDEPTTGVDPFSRREFWNILNELRADRVTIVVTTPYMDEAAKCDRVALIHKGKILMTAEPGDLPKRFKRTLIELKSDQNFHAAKILTKNDQFDSVQSFGDRVHVSGRESVGKMSKNIKESLEKKSISIISIKRIDAGIEDVFIELLK